MTIACGSPGQDSVFLLTLKFQSTFEVISVDKIDTSDLSTFNYNGITNTNFGESIAYGDVNLDGFADLLISSNTSIIYILYYNEFNIIYDIQQIFAYNFENVTQIGQGGIAVLGDVDGDGLNSEIITLAYFEGITNNKNLTHQLITFTVSDEYQCPTSSPTSLPTPMPSSLPVYPPTPYPTPSPTGIPTDKQVLMELYDSTNGQNWFSKTNWMTSKHPCHVNYTWTGINCDDSYQVTGMEFEFNNLAGTIPSEMGLLSSLTSFRFFMNSLTGTIPSQLGYMSSSLNLFMFFSNQLSGTIPSELGQLTSNTFLVVIESAVNGGIPSQIGKLTNCEILGIANSQVSSTIPSEIGLMTQISQLV